MSFLSLLLKTCRVFGIEPPAVASGMKTQGELWIILLLICDDAFPLSVGAIGRGDYGLLSVDPARCRSRFCNNGSTFWASRLDLISQ